MHVYSYGTPIRAWDIYSRKFSNGLIFENFESSQAYFFERSIKLSCLYTLGMFRSDPRIMALLKYFKCIKPYKKEIKNSKVLPKPDCPLAPLMPSLTMEATNS